MKKSLSLFFLISISSFVLGCNTFSNEEISDITDSDSLYTVIVDFKYGEDFSSSSWKNIYVIWMEDTTSGFLQNIFICQKLITGGLTGTVLPFWKTNKYPISSNSEIDAVTSATKANTDFSVSAVLNDSTIRNFVLYFEVDRSYEPNDWFTDQPALLYSANVNLDDNTSEYELLPVGWTQSKGKLQTEMKYITNHKDGSSFGAEDERSSTRMVKKITATIKSTDATNLSTIESDDLSVSIFPNPTQGQINIKSTEIIREVILNNMQGQTLLHIQPNTFKTAIVLNRNIASAGTYFIKIKTLTGVSTQKIQITK